MKKYRVLLKVAALALWPGLCVHGASVSGAPGSYLDFAGGIQVSGMGRAFVGLAEGADAVAWNPAGLALLRPNVIGFMHTQTAESARLDYLGYAQPIYRWGGMGLSYMRLDSGSLPETNEYNQEVGKFSDVEQAIMLGYGITPMNPLSVGGTFKFAQQKVSGSSANGWGMDLGLLARFRNHFRVGMRVQNLIAPSLRYETARDSFPRLVTLGLAGKWLDDRLLLSADLEKGADAARGFNWRLGAEGTLWKVAKLRAGFDFAMKEFSVGLGYQWGRSGVGMALGSSEAGFSQKVGMDYAFGGYDIILRAEPLTFSPMGLKKRTTFMIQLNHTRPIDHWALVVKNEQNEVVYRAVGSGAPPQELTWDGKTVYGGVVPVGAYGCALTVTDKDGRVETTPVQYVRVQYGTPLDNLEMSFQ
ncbi:MAG TPA: hypothetical protein DEB40_00210 [Elusimicrobia bacterium]|nr:hypothetical protein [Elusimicrobiota bacterium]HBT60156.1 hypothetical protein [Elusimicrobiota bacterium]